MKNVSREYQYFDRLHSQKYRDKNQTREDHVLSLSQNLATFEEYEADTYKNTHLAKVHGAIKNNRFIPAGRIQAALGAAEREVSPFNCSVSQTIHDSIDGIYSALHMSAKILRLGTGIGYNFSPLRPQNDIIKALQTGASGPISYMRLFNTSAALIASAGHRRGAQMGILNIDHPDIEAFIDAKMEPGALHSFNISVGITDDFMYALENDIDWELKFDGKVYKTISPHYLWMKIMNNAYASAEPGVVYLDTMNKTNNLWYCENIQATNPCSEQPLPPYGLCTLGSFNLVGYLYWDGSWMFDYKKFEEDIYAIVEAYDNIFDNAVYAIPQHKEDALNKRRIGLGLTGIANACEMLVGTASYGDPEFIRILDRIAYMLMYYSYKASVELAKKRGPFPLFDPIKYLQSEFVKKLPEDLQSDIEKHGIRNSHLISYAPCGTISQIAGNVSSGVEPIFYHEVDREVFMKEGKEKITLKDWAYREHGFKGRTLEECTIDQHLAVAEVCQKYCDSAVSKTVNVPTSCGFKEYVDTYEIAYKMGLKGMTVFRPTTLRGSVITKSENKEENSVEPKEAVNASEHNTFTCASGACER